jgi:hypothetical protein
MIFFPLGNLLSFWRGLLLIIQSGQSRAKVGNKLRVPTPLLLLTADVWGLVGIKLGKMKFIFVLIAMLMSNTANAQAPFTIYKPVTVPERSYTIPDISFPDPLEDMRKNQAAQAVIREAQAQAMEIVSSDIITVDGYNLITEKYFPLKVKIIRRRSGKVEFHCLGIKKQEKWVSCEKEIVPLETLYNQASKKSEKDMILELMEYGNFLLVLDPKTEIFIIK